MPFEIEAEPGVTVFAHICADDFWSLLDDINTALQAQEDLHEKAFE